MYHIVRKLKSEDGASLSIALLFFIVCAVVGSVILSAGTAASGRVAKLKLAEANASSLKRCAYYMCDELKGQQLVIISNDDGSFTYLDSEGEPLGNLISGNSISFVGRLAANAGTRTTPVKIILKDNTKDIFASDTAADDGIRVKCQGVMDEHYNITLVFTPDTPGSSDISTGADGGVLPVGTVTAGIPALIDISEGGVTKVCWTAGKVSVTK